MTAHLYRALQSMGAAKPYVRTPEERAPFDALSNNEQAALVMYYQSESDGRGHEEPATAGEARQFLRSLEPENLQRWYEAMMKEA